MQSIEQLALNIWDDEERGWRMAVYPITADGLETSVYWAFTPSKDQIIRYLQLSEDSDWWVYNNHPDFNYILTGTTN